MLQLHAFKFSTPNTGIGKLPKCKIPTYFSNEFYHLFLDYGTSLNMKQAHAFLHYGLTKDQDFVDRTVHP